MKLRHKTERNPSGTWCSVISQTEAILMLIFVNIPNTVTCTKMRLLQCWKNLLPLVWAKSCPHSFSLKYLQSAKPSSIPTRYAHFLYCNTSTPTQTNSVTMKRAAVCSSGKTKPPIWCKTPEDENHLDYRRTWFSMNFLPHHTSVLPWTYCKSILRVRVH